MSFNMPMQQNEHTDRGGLGIILWSAPLFYLGFVWLYLGFFAVYSPDFNCSGVWLAPVASAWSLLPISLTTVISATPTLVVEKRYNLSAPKCPWLGMIRCCDLLGGCWNQSRITISVKICVWLSWFSDSNLIESCSPQRYNDPSKHMKSQTPGQRPNIWGSIKALERMAVIFPSNQRPSWQRNGLYCSCAVGKKTVF